jgi:multidrug efflux pump subunit AcrA (membrane-fusion protein)
LDISRKKQNSSFIKRYLPWALLAVVVGSGVNYSWSLTQAGFSIDSERLVYDEVKRGDFSVSVRGSGLLVPDKIQWLSASVEARVDQILVKPGKVVKQGDLIALLSNPKLEQLLEETRWELEARVAESKADEVAQKSAMLLQRSQMLNVKLNYESSQLKLNAQSELFRQKTGAVSKIDYEQTRLETNQLKQRWNIQKDILKTLAENSIAQKNARHSRLLKMQKTLERAEQQVSHLTVYASIDSVVQEVAIEPGQRIAMGSNIAKLAQQDSLIAELQVPELQIREVAIGQRVIIDTRNNEVTGIVSRIDPAVVNGNVQVDVEFIEALPSDARPDLSIDGEIKIAEISNTLFINRPLFAQSESNSSLYKVSADGKYAERITVKLGKGSINQVQILEGLSLGEKVIISDPSTWDSYQKVSIN